MSGALRDALAAPYGTEHRREAQTKEELMVSNDVMRLEVKRLRDALNGAADDVFSLENRRQQLAMSMKERKAEIQVQQDAIHAKTSRPQTVMVVNHANKHQLSLA